MVEHALPPSACATPSSDGEPPAGLLHDDLHGGQVPQAARRARRPRRTLPRRRACASRSRRGRGPARLGRLQRDEGVTRAVVVERADVAVGQVGLLERRHGRHADGMPVREGAPPPGRPPAAAERRRGDHADHELAVELERDQRGPDRDAADEVRRAVDRVDDPPPRAPAGPTSPSSSPNSAWSGRASVSRARIAASVPRSASVTSVRLAFAPRGGRRPGSGAG